MPNFACRKVKYEEYETGLFGLGYYPAFRNV